MTNPNERRRNVCVVVLGDIGRSPRMQYHVRSLIENNFTIDLIGYTETVPIKDIQQSHVKIHRLTQFPNLNLPGSLLNYIFKTIWQLLSLMAALFSVRRPHAILCQNPPAIPTLFVCYFYAKLMRSRFIIDWHNYAYSIMALGSSERAPIVRFAKWIECQFGRKSNANLCVTKAMQQDLRENWNIDAQVLYDKPPLTFQSITLEQKHELFKKLAKIYPEFKATDGMDDEIGIERTAFTEKHDRKISYRPNRPAILFSSTSWTPDEDFNILFKALNEYEQKAIESSRYPRILCIITGKGPQKAEYMKLIASRQWRRITVLAPWLESDDYPQMIAAADLGVCLHWSSSGLDLPMKIVDMFGCGLPVCAVNFKCLSELVRHGENGFTFDTYEQLSEQLNDWFIDFPQNVALINIKEIFQKKLRQFQSVRWPDNWNENALSLFL